MKLLFINGHLNTGGVEKSLVDILTHIDTNQHEVDLLLLEGLGDYADQLPPDIHVNLHCLTNTYGSLGTSLIRCIRQHDWLCLKMRLIFLLMKFFGQEKISLAKNLLTDGKHYDCVIGFRRGICTQIASHAVNADRKITWWHHGVFNADPESYFEEVKNCDKIVSVSNACSTFIAEAVPQLSSKLVMIPNMLDTSIVQKKASLFSPYQQDDRLHIVSVGGLVPEKHFQNAIFAAKTLKELGISFRWHLVGDGPERAFLEKVLSDAGIQDCFIMEGNQPNPYPYMKNADLFVHPSYVESQGIVVMEAMALGIPCVVTKSLGPCEFIEDGINGILTEQCPEDLSEKVLNILSDTSLYKQIKSHTRCPDSFLPHQVMKKITSLLENI